MEMIWIGPNFKLTDYQEDDLLDRSSVTCLPCCPRPVDQTGRVQYGGFMFLSATRCLRASASVLLLLFSSASHREARGQNLNFPTPTLSANVAMGTAPSFASFNGKLYAAFRSNDSRNQLFVASSTDGLNFSAATGYSSITMGSAPSLTVFNNKLYLAFQANDSSHALFVTSSSDGTTFATAKAYGNITIAGAPSLAAYNGKLYVAFQANDASNALWLGQSSDGVNFTTAKDAYDATGAAPSLAVFNNALYVGFRSNDSRNVLYVASTTSGTLPAATAYTNITMGTAPTLAASNGALYVSFQANDSSHSLFVTASTTGTNFPAATGYGSTTVGGATAAAAFGNGLSIGFQSNDSRNVLYTTSNAGSTSSSGNGFNYTVYPGYIGIDLVNNTNGTYSDGQVYVEVVAINPANNTFSWVKPDGTITAMSSADNNAAGHLTKNGMNYPNYSFTLAQAKLLKLPQLYSGRIYMSLGSPMYMQVVGSGTGVGYAGPNAQNSSDPNNNVHYDWYEFTYNNSGVFINTTQVNQFGLPLLLDVYGNNKTFHQQTGMTESVSQLDSEWGSELPSNFTSTPISNYRILSPAETNFGSGQANGTYFDTYISQTWSYYASNPLNLTLGTRSFTGKTSGNTFTFNEVNTGNGAFQGGTGYTIGYPNTQQVLVCNGVFATGDGSNADRNSVELAIEAQLCAALNRHVATNTSQWGTPSAYYQAAPANYYAAFWHRHGVGGLAYGFSYDDVAGQSSTITIGQPEHMVFTVGW